MNNSPELVGRLVGVVLFACLALYFLVRGLGNGPRSRRLANLSLFCGLTVFVMPEIALGLSFTDRTWLLLASGSVRILFGLVGIAFGVTAFVKRHDGGGRIRPILGIVFSLLHLWAGVGMLMLNSYTRPTSPWVYQSPEGDFSITLPSTQWQQARETGGGAIVRFVRRFPSTQASVLPLLRDQTEADFRRVVDAFRDRIDTNPTIRQPKFREGTNAAGNFYHFCTAMDSKPSGEPLFIAYSVTWCSRKKMVITLILEGYPIMGSQSGAAAEKETFMQDAEAICLSVE